CRRLVKSGVKARGSAPEVHRKLADWSAIEEGGISGVAVESGDIRGKTGGGGGPLGRCCRGEAKAGGGKRIRNPGRASGEHWVLGVRGVDPLSAAANALSTPPGDYGRKVKTQRN